MVSVEVVPQSVSLAAPYVVSVKVKSVPHQSIGQPPYVVSVEVVPHQSRSGSPWETKSGLNRKRSRSRALIAGRIVLLLSCSSTVGSALVVTLFRTAVKIVISCGVAKYWHKLLRTHWGGVPTIWIIYLLFRWWLTFFTGPGSGWRTATQSGPWVLNPPTPNWPTPPLSSLSNNNRPMWPPGDSVDAKRWQQNKNQNPSGRRAYCLSIARKWLSQTEV